MKIRSIRIPLAAQRPLRCLCAAFIFSFLYSGFSSADSGNSCNTCHKTISGVRYLEHDYSDWEHSIHAKANIGCEACHGGNPAGQDQAQAHAGLKPSTDSSSPVYFTRIPATCGACHQAEYKAFQKSVHYQALQRTGRGPNCVSCHGSMANHVLAPRDLEQSCSLCHSKPTQASATMLALNQANVSVKRLGTVLQEAKGRHVSVTSQENVFQELQALQKRAVEDWHTFKMGEVLKASHAIAQRATNAVNEIHLKEQQQKP